MTSPAFLTLSAPLTLSSFTLSKACRVSSGRVAFRVSSRSRCSTPRMPLEAAAVESLTTTPTGEENTFEYRLFYNSSSGVVSPWHDIPLWPDTSSERVLNFVNEIPKGTNAKMEIATDEISTPIKQDVKKGVLRVYKYGPSLVNYGALPQTWENPGEINVELGVGGDGDPVDLTEIGNTVMPFGSVYKVKVLGCLALLDEGEIDWKIIGINIYDPMAGALNNISDIEKVMPGKVGEIREWFRMYKTAEGKGENEYAYNGEAKDAEFAMNVVQETHESWKKLRNGEIKNTDDLALK